MSSISDKHVVKVRRLLDEIHRQIQSRAGALVFRSMADISEAEDPPDSLRARLKRRLRTLGLEIHQGGGLLLHIAEVAIRDERDASVLAASWDGIGGFYR